MVAKPTMSREAEAKNLRLYDRRTIERNIKKGLITRKDYDKFLKALGDAKDKGTQESVDGDVDAAGGRAAQPTAIRLGPADGELVDRPAGEPLVVAVPEDRREAPHQRATAGSSRAP